MKSVKTIIALLLCALTLFVGVGCSASNSTSDAGSSVAATDATSSSAESTAESASVEAADGEPIKVAVMGPMTGNFAIYGEAYKAAVTLRMNQYNDAGGYNGRPIELSFYDDKNDPNEGVNCAQMIVNDSGVIACIGPWSSTVAFAVEPILTKAEIILYAPSPSHADLTDMSEYVVRQTLVQQRVAEAAANGAYEHGLTKAAYLYESTNDAAAAAAENFKGFYEALGGTIVGLDGFQAGTKDFSALITKYKAAGVDNLHMFASYNDAALLINQARELELDCIIALVGSAAQPEFYPLIEGQEDIFLIDPYIIDFDSDSMRDFVSAYREQTGGDPSVHAYLAYTAADHMIIGMEEVGLDTGELAKFLRDDPAYESPLGTLTFINGTPKPPVYWQRFNGTDGFVYDPDWN